MNFIVPATPHKVVIHKNKWEQNFENLHNRYRSGVELCYYTL